MIFNNEEITNETLIKTDKHFADICQGCIDEVISGKVKVNNKEDYIIYNKNRRNLYLKGLCRSSFTYLQRAYYIQTGCSVPLFEIKSRKEPS